MAFENGVKNVQAAAYNGVRTAIIAVNTKYAFKRIFFQHFMVCKACNCKKIFYHIWHFIIKFDWIFYDTSDNISFQVYAKVSVITFLFIFSLDMFMIFLLVFWGL